MLELKPIPDFPGYAADREGNVYSCKVRSGYVMDWMKLKQYERPGGRMEVALSANCKQKKFLVHRAVMLAFNGAIPRGMECCHNDGNPKNNKLENLRFDTHKGNLSDRVRHGTLIYGDAHVSSKLTSDQVRDIFRRYSQGETQKQIGQSLGVAQTAISKILRRTRWKQLAIPTAA